ncbi:hypothetical protein MTsPCn5_17860 [Croceitalea sp. MTPC5]|nr:hypothetical protein MTsPCn5_17860 [Croceitalea sp. MTPC5]
MKRYLLHICWLVMLIPCLGFSQESTTNVMQVFYTDLAKRDALHEQQLTFVNLEDQEDFWQDQNDFENLLGKENPKAYQVYLKGKRMAYRLHQKECDASCGHGENYVKKAAFYSIHALETTYAFKTKKPQIRD